MRDQKISNLKIAIEANSIDTFDKKRDSHLIKEDFFYAKKFPLIRIWKEDAFFIKEGNPSQVMLNVQIKDKKKVIPFYITYKGQRSDPMTNKVGHYFSIKSKLNRKDFSITWNKKLDNGGLLLSDMVKIYGEFEAYEVGKKPAFSRFFTPDKSEIKRVEPDLKKKYTNKVVENHTTSVKPDQEQEIFSLKNLVITFITGFTLFLLMIAFSYYGQKYMIEFLERRGFEEKTAYIISNTITMIIVIFMAMITAPYMGLGPNPLTKWF